MSCCGGKMNDNFFLSLFHRISCIVQYRMSSTTSVLCDSENVCLHKRIIPRDLEVVNELSSVETADKHNRISVVLTFLTKNIAMGWKKHSNVVMVDEITSFVTTLMSLSNYLRALLLNGRWMGIRRCRCRKRMSVGFVCRNTSALETCLCNHMPHHCTRTIDKQL